MAQDKKYLDLTGLEIYHGYVKAALEDLDGKLKNHVDIDYVDSKLDGKAEKEHTHKEISYSSNGFYNKFTFTDVGDPCVVNKRGRILSISNDTYDTGYYDYTFPDKDGTVALTSDIPTDYVNTTSAQEIYGSKTFKDTFYLEAATPFVLSKSSKVGMRATNASNQNLGQVNITDSLKNDYDGSMVAQMSAMDKDGKHHSFKISGLGPMYAVYDNGVTTDYKLALEQDLINNYLPKTGGTVTGDTTFEGIVNINNIMSNALCVGRDDEVSFNPNYNTYKITGSNGFIQFDPNGLGVLEGGVSECGIRVEMDDECYASIEPACFSLRYYGNYFNMSGEEALIQVGNTDSYKQTTISNANIEFKFDQNNWLYIHTVDWTNGGAFKPRIELKDNGHNYMFLFPRKTGTFVVKDQDENIALGNQDEHANINNTSISVSIDKQDEQAGAAIKSYGYIEAWYNNRSVYISPEEEIFDITWETNGAYYNFASDVCSITNVPIEVKDSNNNLTTSITSESIFTSELGISRHITLLSDAGDLDESPVFGTADVDTELYAKGMHMIDNDRDSDYTIYYPNKSGIFAVIDETGTIEIPHPTYAHKVQISSEGIKKSDSYKSNGFGFNANENSTPTILTQNNSICVKSGDDFSGQSELYEFPQNGGMLALQPLIVKVNSEIESIKIYPNRYYIFDNQVFNVNVTLADVSTTYLEEFMGEIRVDEQFSFITFPNTIRWCENDKVSISNGELTLEPYNTYVFSIANGLGLITNIPNPTLPVTTVNIDNKILTWEPVEGAQQYALMYNYEVVKTVNADEELQIDLSTCIDGYSTGAKEFKLTLMSKSKHHNDSFTYFTYYKTETLSAPTNLVLSDAGVLSWNSVTNADTYIVTCTKVQEDPILPFVNETTVVNNYVDLNDYLAMNSVAGDVWRIKVKATNTTNDLLYLDSADSMAVLYTYGG